MFGFHERRKLKRYFFSYLSLGVLLVLVIMLGWSVWGIAKGERETREKREMLASERDALLVRSEELHGEIQKLKTRGGIEAELRERFEVGAPGEKLVVIVDPELPLGEEVPPRPQGFWGWLKSWFD